MLDRLAESPAEAIIGVTHYMHGAVCRVAPEATAFPLRTSGGVHFRVGMDWSDPAASTRLMEWARDTMRHLPGSTGERIYANYQSEAPAGSSAAVYGGNLARLATLKRTYDPDNVFRRNSNVSPGAP